MKKLKGFRASILHFMDRLPDNISDNKTTNKHFSYQYLSDGLLIVKDGKVMDIGNYIDLINKYDENLDLITYEDKLIMPGFIDTHVHYAQTDIIGSYGEQLLEWLRTYTFPTEIKFKDKEIALETAEFFLEELLRNGTTSATVFCTIHPESVDALFEKSLEKNMRVIAGKVHMDRHAPKDLLDSVDEGLLDAEKLIKKWHNKGRLSYAITPRFAPTSTPEQLKSLQQLYSIDNNLYMQTHLSENTDEIKWVKSLFPQADSYLDVYSRNKLVRKRSIFAHCIHLEEAEYETLSRKGSSISFCPTSNLFLGSGLFDFEKALDYGIPVGIGSDVGAGTSFSIIRNLGEAYKICQLNNQKFSSLQAFYTATLGGAKSMYIDDKVGNFEKNKEADFVVIDFNATPLMARRYKTIKTLQEKLFMLMIMGGTENIHSTYIMGEKMY